jgi:uncharacterized protein
MFTIKLDEITEDGLDLQWREERASLSTYLENFSNIDFAFETEIEGTAKITKAAQTILIKGGFRTLLRLHCARCLKEFLYPLSSSFDLTLYPSREASLEEEVELAEEDMESGFYEGGEIPLSEIACEQIFLEIPCQPVCDEGCRGLCSVCGKDLNLGSCGCPRENFETGFAVLGKLKLDH